MRRLLDDSVGRSTRKARGRARWRRGALGATAVVGLVFVSGCYGPLQDATSPVISVRCDKTTRYPDGSEDHSQDLEDASVVTRLPEWTTPGPGTPFAVGLDLSDESSRFGLASVTVAATGLDAGSVTFSWTFENGTWTPLSDPASPVVTAAPGDDVVLRMTRASLTGIAPAPGGEESIEETCVPANPAFPVVARVPVTSGAPSTATTPAGAASAPR